ncbi:MAG: polysaccharide biosynthesis C-terminal domain-containing protein [Oscillospiraceae bacterium]|nr:polysaccharide biosynthesis C-terminal domain-containing protein [Oscillospiraceae bacterium]
MESNKFENKTEKSSVKMLKNAVILFTAMAITKLVSAALKIPLTNILGGLGMGYFSTAFSLFSPVYAVTAAAIPTVIMRLTAQNAASGRYKNVRRIRRAGLFAAFGLGLAGSIGILIIAKPFSTYIAGSPGSLPAMLVIAPSLFFCSVSAVYRGYYEGLSNMIPTAISQIIEALIKSVTGIFLAFAFIPHGIEYAAAAAIAGVTISEFFGLIFMFARTRLGSDGIPPDKLKNSPPPQRKRVIIKTIMGESLPITLAALSMNLNPFIDMMTISSTINSVIADNKAFFLQSFTYGAYGGEAISDIGNFIYGSYTGITLPIFAIATSVTAMIGKSALPEITAAHALKDNAPKENQQENSPSLIHSLRMLFKGTFMVGLPICIGLAVLAKPILSLLYFSRPAEVLVSTPPLVVLGLGGITLILAGTLFSIFMAIGRADLQIKLMLAGAAIKLAANLILIRIPHVNVTGAAIATVLSYTFVSIAGLIILKGVLKTKLKIARHIAQPMFFALLCGATAYICYNYAFIERGSLLRLAMSIAAGALVYLTMTLIFNLHFLPRRPNYGKPLGQRRKNAQIPHH